MKPRPSTNYRDALAHWVARRLPRRLRYWTTIDTVARRAAEVPHQEVPGILAVDLLNVGRGVD